MAKKTQTQEMKDAYGTRFSQQDLTTPSEHQQPLAAITESTKSGGIALFALLTKNRKVSLTKKQDQVN